MCQLYLGADPLLYRSRARSLRLHGMVTSVRLENQFWAILERMAAQENTSSSRLISRSTTSCSRIEARSRISHRSCACAASASRNTG